MREIKINEVVIARIISSEDWKEGLSFFSQDEDFIQVGTWVYQSGKKLAAHFHNKVERKITHTQEVIFVKQGKINAMVYDLNNVQIETAIVSAGEIIVLLNGGHGYDILEDNTQVLEIKNGPYPGAEADRTRL